MRGIVVYLTVVSLVVHLTFGCCGHHAHACTSSCTAHGSAEFVCTASADGRIDNDCSPPLQRHSHPGETNHCQGVSCVFVKTAAPSVEKNECQSVCYNALDAAISLATHSSSIDRLDNSIPFSPSSEPLYLLHQIFLI